MFRAFRQITAKYRKRYQRTGEPLLIGIKSLECNFNPLKLTYNPHLHIIVPNEKIAKILVDEWLAKWTSKFTHRAAQFTRQVKDLERDLVETIKYGSKVFTEPDLDKQLNKDGDGNIYAAALYNIFEAMKGLRIFDRFGFNLPPLEKEIREAKIVTNFCVWRFMLENFDWQNVQNELVLSAYNPPPDLVKLLENNIDLKFE